jgi:hypothetical protein
MVAETPSLDRTAPPEGLVTENIKTLRLLHQLLIVISAAILVFALRPDQSNDYKAALNELATLKQLSFGGWSNYVAQRYKAETDRDAKFILGVVRQAGVRVKGTPHIGIPVFCDQVPYVNSRLLDLDTFFAKTQRIGFMKFVAERQPVLEQLAKWKAGRSPNVNVIALNVSIASSGVMYPDGSPMADWLNRPTSGTTLAPIYLVTDEQVPQSAYISFTYSPSSETGAFAMEWLHNDIFGKELIDPKRGIVFPRLKIFWSQINQDTPDQTVVFLQEESEASTRGSVSFFGIPVERNLAIYAGPVACSSILLFLCLHLRHFRSLGASRDAIKVFPWVPLFAGVWGISIAVLTILVLPTSANALLLIRFGHSTDVSNWLAMVFGALVLGTGVWATCEVWKLRKQLLS